MYHQLGLGGRSVWTAVVFFLWCVITWQLMHCTFVYGMSLGEDFRLWLRSAGLAPVLADLLKFCFAFFGLFGVPFLTIITTVSLNKKLKGAP